MNKKKKKSFIRNFQKLKFLIIFFVPLLFASKIYFHQKNTKVLAESDTTQVSWKINIKESLTLSQIASLGGLEKTKQNILNNINKKISGKNIRSTITSASQNNSQILNTTLEATTTVKDLRDILYSDLKSEINILGGESQFFIKGNTTQNQSILVTLESNPSTGYLWYFTGSNNGAIKEEKSAKFANKKTLKQEITGASVYQTMYLKTNKSGINSFQLNHKRSWENKSVKKQVELNLENIPYSLNLADIPTTSVTSVVKETFTSTTNSVYGFLENIKNKFSSPKKDKVKGVITLPSAFDWRAQGKLSDIRDQASCGSCNVFATQAAFESAKAIEENNSPIKTSEQFIVSCNDFNYNCSTGFGSPELFDINRLGLLQTTIGAVRYEDFPYTGSNVACKANLNHPYKAYSWTKFYGSLQTITTDQIKQAIYQHGPVYTTVCSGSSEFMGYKTGVFTKDVTSCGSGFLHAVNLVGWDDSLQAWILRNSWGTGWGMNGYMYIKYGVSNVGEERLGYFQYIQPIPTATPTPTPKPTSTPTPIPSVKPSATPTLIKPTPTINSVIGSRCGSNGECIKTSSSVAIGSVCNIPSGIFPISGKISYDSCSTTNTSIRCCVAAACTLGTVNGCYSSTRITKCLKDSTSQVLGWANVNCPSGSSCSGTGTSAKCISTLNPTVTATPTSTSKPTSTPTPTNVIGSRCGSNGECINSTATVGSVCNIPSGIFSISGKITYDSCSSTSSSIRCCTTTSCTSGTVNGCYSSNKIIKCIKDSTSQVLGWANVNCPSGYICSGTGTSAKCSIPTSSLNTINNNDTVAPTIIIYNPIDKEIIIKRTNIDISANVKDNEGGSGVNKVDFYVNNNLLCSDNSFPFICSWKVPNKSTSFIIEVKAQDNSSNQSSSKITVNSN